MAPTPAVSMSAEPMSGAQRFAALPAAAWPAVALAGSAPAITLVAVRCVAVLSATAQSVQVAWQATARAGNPSRQGTAVVAEHDRPASRKGYAVSSAFVLAFMGLGLGLLACLFALIVLFRRPAAPSAVARDEQDGAEARRQLDEVGQDAEQILSRAQSQAAQIVQRAEASADQAEKARGQAEDEARALKAELRELRSDLERRESRLTDREQRLDDEGHKLEERSAGLDEIRGELERRGAELDKLDAQRREVLERVAGLTSEQAKGELVANIENQAKREAALTVRDIEKQARTDGEERARRIVTLAIQRVATEQTTESVVSVLHLPSDEMKGRIIGREGRNIRTFESVTGVNLIIDDTPEAVLLSCFDPVRREVGRLTLERLVLDGRIHPQRIEEAHERSQAEVAQLCVRAGEDALVELGVTDMHPELVTLLEGSHALVGAEIARRYGEPEDVVHAIEAHHNEVEVRTVEAVLTQAADAISGGRPGARRESLESYVKRLERLEQIAAAHEGVEKVFAMQAGREIRVMVKPERVDDIHAQVIARDVAKQIEEELIYPGQIRITVVRESRATEFAR